MYNNRNNSGITLIALVITIIVLLILAGVSISAIVGKDNIIQKAKEAKEKTEIAAINEKLKLDSVENIFATNSNIEEYLDEWLGIEKMINFNNDVNDLPKRAEIYYIKKIESQLYRCKIDIVQDYPENRVTSDEVLEKTNIVKENEDVMLQALRKDPRLEDLGISATGSKLVASNNKPFELVVENEGNKSTIFCRELELAKVNKLIKSLETNLSNSNGEIAILLDSGKIMLPTENPLESKEMFKDKNIIDICHYRCYSIWSVLLLDENGKVYEWEGRSRVAVIPPNPILYEKGPVCLNDDINSALHGKRIRNFSIAETYRMALDEKGKLYYWEPKYYFDLADKRTVDENAKPVCLTDNSSSIFYGKTITKLKIENEVGTIIDSNGDLYYWNGKTNGFSNEKVICITKQSNNDLYGKKVVDVDNGNNCTVAIDNLGKVYTWGNNEYGQLGNGNTTPSDFPICISNLPGNILSDKKIIKIENTSRSNIIAVIDENGKLYTWGYNKIGFVGNGSSGKNVLMPICISDDNKNSLYGKKITSVETGENGCIALDENGEVHIWGVYEIENDFSESYIPVSNKSANSYNTILFDKTKFRNEKIKQIINCGTVQAVVTENGRVFVKPCLIPN